MSTLLEKRKVNKSWWKLCNKTIQDKCGQNGRKAFQSRDELRYAIWKYTDDKPTDMEEFACTYGYPQDMSFLFEGVDSFHETIASWEVSNVSNMRDMFAYASHFNQNIGSWDVSNVTDMSYMFGWAATFNQDIGSWDVSSVTDKHAQHVSHGSEFQSIYWILGCLQRDRYEPHIFLCT
jgi:surface protein